MGWSVELNVDGLVFYFRDYTWELNGLVCLSH